MRPATRRVLVAAALGVGAIVATSAPAAADPPRPTDYRTEVGPVEPAVAGLVVEMVGGDSLVQLQAPRGRTVEVVGYKGEVFLVFHPDGRVEEDHASYTYRTSRSRYGSDVDAEQGDRTDFRTVSTDGTWAWHDHRSHLMTTARPLGRSPGDQVSEGVLPLRVDGREVRVRLATFWVPGPSPVSAAAGVLLAALAVLGTARATRRWRPVCAIAAAVLACTVGVGVVRAVPGHVGTRPVEWVLPAAALALAGLAAGDRSGARRAAWCVLSALVLVEWSWSRRGVLTKPVLPTVLPTSFDRACTAAVIVLALVVAADALRSFAVRPAPA